MAADSMIIAALYAHERIRLHRRFLRRGVCSAGAADLVQETFMRLMRSRTEDIHDLRAYLYRTADAAEYDMRRGEVRARRIIHPQVEPDTTVADPRPAIEAQIINREEHEAIRAAIDNLPPRAREVLILHKFENMSYIEIAQHLGISRNTVMVHMVKALGVLRLNLVDPRKNEG